MKKVVICLCLLIALCGCTTKILRKEIDVKDLEFSEKQDYIIENKDNLSRVTVTRQTNGSRDCYLLDNDEMYEVFTNVKKAKDNAIMTTDDYISYVFEFTDGTGIAFSFSGTAYEEDGNSYDLSDFKHAYFDEDKLYECE